MVEPDRSECLEFHDTALTASGDLKYLGGEWRREVAFAGFEVPIKMDVSAETMIFRVSGTDPKRRDELIKVLGIDLSWRMHNDGTSKILRGHSHGNSFYLNPSSTQKIHPPLLLPLPPQSPPYFLSPLFSYPLLPHSPPPQLPLSPSKILPHRPLPLV